MQHARPPLPPRVGVQVGSDVRRAVPVPLDGHSAALVMDDAPAANDHTRLRLDWDDGRVTELDVRVRSLESAGQVARMEIHGVRGDWRPFLEYVGHARP